MNSKRKSQVMADNLLTFLLGGGGLVQQLKKSYSLSDLSGETEDENRNMTKSYDETDMQIESHRRERIGRRGYSPRRTQSNSNNRVEMYFSEVDVEVRQSKTKESTASLTNIKSSDDISSGYSSGEALHTQRGLTQTETPLVRTASVGARTRLKQPRTTVKKMPEAIEECTSNETMPLNPLSIINTEQALNILSYLSKHEACADFIRLGPNITPDIFGSNENISRESSTESLYSTSESQDSSTLKDEVELNKTFAENKECDEMFSKLNDNNEQEKEKELEREIDLKVEDTNKIKHELGQTKLEELKMLLDEAKSKIENVVSSQERRNSDISNKNEEVGNMRAGKYNKKPAPKVPFAESQKEDLEKAVKATLVIKSGTLTTITKISDEKYDSKKKLNLSKLLTIPKNIFHHTFHKDDEGKDEGSRRSSIGSHKDVIIQEGGEVLETCLSRTSSGYNKESSIASPMSDNSNKQIDEKDTIDEENNITRKGRPMFIRRLSQSPGRSNKQSSTGSD